MEAAGRNPVLLRFQDNSWGLLKEVLEGRGLRWDPANWHCSEGWAPVKLHADCSPAQRWWCQCAGAQGRGALLGAGQMCPDIPCSLEEALEEKVEQELRLGVREIWVGWNLDPIAA